MTTIPTRKALALVLVLATAGWLQAAPPAGKSSAGHNCYVVSAGIDNYPKSHLDGCLNDARNTVATFRSQKGTMYGNVSARTLLDGQATRAEILKEWTALTKRGQAGDTMVLFLSGHGGNDNGNWAFSAYDEGLADRDILAGADALAAQGKKVVIIIDACFSGQLRTNAKEILDKYRDAKGGGIVLLLSSASNQLSAALGKYSAFAKAFVDSVDGSADLNRDGKITLSEVKSYSTRRTHDLMRLHKNEAKQDAEVAWSPSMSGATTFAMTPATRVFSGRETLARYGTLSFRCYVGGRVQMTDNDGTTEGVWQQSHGIITLRFGSVVYTGRVNGRAISGTAVNGAARWTFAVRS